MNTYKKYCPIVFVAVCDEAHEKGDLITLTTKYGKENKHIVHNFLGYLRGSEKRCYSITREDGYNNQMRAKNKAEKLSGYKSNAIKRSEDWREKSNEGSEFLALGEPIKVGHHSEKRHRNLIERNWSIMTNAMNELEKAESYEGRIKYWESMANKIDLSMPESIEFFAEQLKEAKEYHAGLKDGSIARRHSFSLTYAKKKVNELQKKVDLSIKLWGDTNVQN